MLQRGNDAESQKHMRAICDEIGERLSCMLARTAQEPPARLAALLRCFEELEQTQAPSIVPMLEDIRAYRVARRRR